MPFYLPLEQSYSDVINYKIHSLLIYSNINEINNHFAKLINEEKLEIYLSKINQNNNIKYILIDKKEIKGNINNKEEDLYILYNIILYNEYSMIGKKCIKFFLINIDYMKELESIIFYDEIKELLFNNNQINFLNIYNNEENHNIINQVKNLMSENLIQRIQNIKNENLEIKLSARKILNIQNYIHENSNISYLNNCQVITENIILLIQKYIHNIKIEIECFINGNTNIYSRLNKETICLGKLILNNIFQTKYIIYSPENFYIDNIMNEIKKMVFIQL